MRGWPDGYAIVEKSHNVIFLAKAEMAAKTGNTYIS